MCYEDKLLHSLGFKQQFPLAVFSTKSKVLSPLKKKPFENIVGGEYGLSHNPCFKCNIAITNFLVSHKCKMIFHNVIRQSTIYIYITCIPTQKF